MAYKIKKGTDLKEFEKFGFKYRKGWYIEYLKELTVTSIRIEPEYNGEKNTYFYISVYNQGIATNCDFETVINVFTDYKQYLEKDIEIIKNTFENLIQAGLVEVVEED